MSETPNKAASLKDVEAVRDLFARAHDYIAQANHPGHLGMKVAEVLNFLAFQYSDFKTRAENLSKQIASEVDIKAAQEATAAVLTPETKAAAVETQTVPETPKA
jgi:hypothetical protein